MLIKRWEAFRAEAYDDGFGNLTIGYGFTEEMPGFKDRYAFGALCSLAWNVGPSAVLSSTLMKRIEASDYEGAANRFMDWIYVRKDGTPSISKGLVLRRVAERDLFRRSPSRSMAVDVDPVPVFGVTTHSVPPINATDLC